MTTDIQLQSGKYTILLSDFITALNKWMNDYEEQHYPGSDKSVITVEPGRKYIKLVVSRYGSRSVYCFLDRRGNIYKSASWKAPAKHVRGTVFESDYSIGRSLGPYGAAYLR
jgi:hypothetical protein